MSDLCAERTSSHNPGIRHGAHRRRDILATFLAANREVALPGFWKIEHEGEYRRTKGEISRSANLGNPPREEMVRLSAFISMN